MTMGKDKAGRGLPSVAVFFLVLLATPGVTLGQGPKASAMFGFGDSYADTGNQNHLVSSWKKPYGITWPGYPTGRFGNGHIQTDYIADVLGLPSPTPIVDAAKEGIALGANFALGGSGVTYALGVPPLWDQVDEFELVVKSGVYSPSFLADAVTLVSNVGNDYSANFTSTQEYLAVIEQVIEGLTLALGRLYELGLRNILVANLPPIDCVPDATKITNFTSCIAPEIPLIVYHNGLLQQAVAKLNTRPYANYIILDEQKAFTYVLNNTEEYGITDLLTPCCLPNNLTNSCGDVDILGKPLYTVCDDPTTHVYWDGAHPVQSTWRHVVELFTNKPGFLLGASTLETWLYQNSLRPTLPPAPAPSGSSQGAVGELETAYDALLSEPDYLESVGLLQAINLDEYLAGYPMEKVTVFLPNLIAYYSLPVARIDQIYGQDEVLPVVKYHVVKGYYDSHRLSNSVLNLTTISGLPLRVISGLGLTLVGPEEAFVVKPDLYKVADLVVVHGIDKILFPPTLQ